METRHDSNMLSQRYSRHRGQGQAMITSRDVLKGTEHGGGVIPGSGGWPSSLSHLLFSPVTAVLLHHELVLRGSWRLQCVVRPRRDCTGDTGCLGNNVSLIAPSNAQAYIQTLAICDSLQRPDRHCTGAAQDIHEALV